MKNIKKILWVVLMISVFSCTNTLDYPEGTHKRVWVDSVTPADGAVASGIPEVRVVLDGPIDVGSLTEDSFMVIRGMENTAEETELETLLSQLDKGEYEKIAGRLEFVATTREIIWVPRESLQTMHRYTIVITHRLLSSDRIPFGYVDGSKVRYFRSSFLIISHETETVSSPGEEAVGATFPAQLIIDELLYDSVDGETDGEAFVELFGTPGSSLSGYSIRFMNGATGKAVSEIILPADALIPEDGFFVMADLKQGSKSESHVQNYDYLVDFDPQNGPDSVQLLDRFGTVLDVVGYGEGLMAQDIHGNPLYEAAPAQDVGAGVSLARDEHRDTNDNQNDFKPHDSPSPGMDSAEVSTPENKSEISGTDTTGTEGTMESVAEDVIEEEFVESVPPETAKKVHFSEVVTDPQQDWNDSSGGNGVSFDDEVGSGTVGSTDEWLEIKNSSDEVVNLTNWRIEMLDGTDELFVFDDSAIEIVFSDESGMDSFGQESFAIIGNPAGDMKNSINLILFDENNEVVDELFVEDANASSLADESYQTSDEGAWKMGETTPFF